MITKVCSHCGKRFPCTDEFFHKSKDHSGQHKNICRNCVSAYMKKYYKAKPKKNMYSDQRKSYIDKYRNTFKGDMSSKIACIKRSAKFHNHVPSNRLTLTIDEFMDIAIKFNYKCAYCNTPYNLVPSMIVRFSHNGSLSKNNTVISCSKCNKHKLSQTSHKSFEDWYKSQPFYSQERYNKIINHTKESK